MGEDPCSFLHRLRAERAEPFAEGLALSVELDGQRLRFCGDRMGSVSGNRIGRFGDRVGRLIFYTESKSMR
jgi:hypothetical protein